MILDRLPALGETIQLQRRCGVSDTALQMHHLQVVVDRLLLLDGARPNAFVISDHHPAALPDNGDSVQIVDALRK